MRRTLRPLSHTSQYSDDYVNGPHVDSYSFFRGSEELFLIDGRPDILARNHSGVNNYI